MESIFRFCNHNYYVLIIGLGICFFAIRDFVRSRNPTIKLIGVISILYPIGKILQFTLFGGLWVRGYLGDLGFTCAITLILFFYRSKTIMAGVNNITEYKFRLQKFLGIYLTISLTIAVVAEGIQLEGGRLYALRNAGKMLPGLARGDLNDIAAYIISSIIAAIAINSIAVYPTLKKN